MKFSINKLILAIIPIVLLFLSFWYTSECPYYSGGKSDPEYCYLLNSLNVLNLEMPCHTDHPGTPLQVFGAGVLLGKGIVNTWSMSPSHIQTSVMHDPEDYLHAINFVLNILICVITFLTGLELSHYTNKFFPALILQFSLMCFLQIQVSLSRVSPEPFLVFSALLFIMVLIPEIFVDAAESSNKADIIRPLLAGGVLGLGLATKVTFFPLLLFLFIFEGAKKRVLVIFSCTFSFIFFTLPIYPRYMKMLEWFRDIIIHKGFYGEGPIGLPEMGIFLANVKSLFLEEPFLIIFFALYSLGLILIKNDVPIETFSVSEELKSKRSSNSRLRGHDKRKGKGVPGKADRYGRFTIEAASRSKINKLLRIGCLVILAQIIVTAKHPRVHYLLPSMVVTSIIDAALIYRFFNNGEHAYSSGYKHKLFQIILIIVFAAAFAYNVINVNAWIQEEKGRALATNKLLAKVSNFRQQYKIGFYGSSLPQYALTFGNMFACNHYGTEIQLAYPETIYYQVWQNVFHTAEGRIIDSRFVQTLLDRGDIFIMVGNPDYLKISDGLIVDPLFLDRDEGIFRLIGIRQ